MKAIDLSSPLILSAALDPRFKGMNCLSSSQAQLVKSLLMEMCGEIDELKQQEECVFESAQKKRKSV